MVVLGHLVSERGIQPNNSKVEAISRIKPPTTVTEVKGFIGAVNFYRQFIPGCASISEPLIDLTCKKREKSFIWGPKETLAFEQLKSFLVKAPILQFPDWSKTFYIKTDASDVGIGSVLCQETSRDPEVRLPIMYASRTLKSAERNYSATNREGLAVVWAVKHFYSYINSMKFIIVTDHNSLKAMKYKKKVGWTLTQIGRVSNAV